MEEYIVRQFNSVFSKANRTSYVPAVIIGGKGARVTDSKGREYIDISSSGAVMSIGYNNERVVKAVIEQAKKLLHYSYIYGHTYQALELGKKILSLFNRENLKVSLGFSGSDAVEASLMFVRAYTKRKIIISFSGSLHGVLYGGAEVSGHRVEREVCEKVGCGGRVVFLPYPDPYRCPFRGSKECGKDILELLKVKLEEMSKDELPAAVIAEPIEGDAGIIVPPDNFFYEAYRLLRRYGVPLIMDEIQTGLGRTGEMFAFQHSSIEPELVTLGKPLGGGLPISAVVGDAEILDSLPVMGYTFTVAGNPVLCAASIATIDEILENNLWIRAKTLGEKVLLRLRKFSKNHPLIGDVRGKGLMIGIDLVKDKDTKERAVEETKKVVWRAYEKGVIVYFLMGNVLRIQPPLNIEEEELDTAITVLEEAIEDVEKGKVPDSVLAKVKGW